MPATRAQIDANRRNGARRRAATQYRIQAECMRSARFIRARGLGEHLVADRVAAARIVGRVARMILRGAEAR
jgi:hypothetical protein